MKEKTPLGAWWAALRSARKAYEAAMKTQNNNSHADLSIDALITQAENRKGVWYERDKKERLESL